VAQPNVRLNGHAIEARLYAEDPAGGFLPTGGTVLALREPAAENVRVDSGIEVGTEVGSWYDPMLAKVIAWGPDRPAALARLRQALTGTALLGVRTNLEFLGELLADPEVVAGRLDTELVDRELPRLLAGPGDGRIPDRALAGHGLVRMLALQPPPHAGVVDPWRIPSGWRVGEHQPLLLRADRHSGSAGGEADRPDGIAEIRVWGTPDAARVQVGEGPVWTASVQVVPGGLGGGAGPGGLGGGAGELLITLDGVTRRWLHAVDADRTWLSCEGQTGVVTAAAIRIRGPELSDGAAEVRSPMPGVVLAVQVSEGDEVQAGQPLIVVEAMKMEHSVTAARAGRVDQLLVRVGDQVALEQPLAFIHSAEANLPVSSPG
jgi:acetyl-CoA/propionyl-CoA carboxylase biotin carboxyl carrier protein